MSHDLQDIKQDDPLRLELAATIAFPDGTMTASGLRKEAARGRLCDRARCRQGLHDARGDHEDEGAMPAESKGPHLWLRKARRDERGRTTHKAVWLIIDGSHQESTECGRDDRQGAERALTEYIDRKHLKAAKKRRP